MMIVQILTRDGNRRAMTDAERLSSDRPRSDDAFVCDGHDGNPFEDRPRKTDSFEAHLPKDEVRDDDMREIDARDGDLR